MNEAEREALIEAIQNGAEAAWVDERLTRERQRIAEAIEALCVLGSDDPLSVAAEAVRIARGGGTMTCTHPAERVSSDGLRWTLTCPDCREEWRP